MIDGAVRAAANVLARASRVVAFTGAGVSAESGIPTFRGAGGLWEGSPVEEVATPQGFHGDPGKVWRFYEARRVNVSRCLPNPAHEVLARWQDRFPTYRVATQNVDGLHQLAGASDVLELHGSLWRLRCTGCGRERADRQVPLPELPPHCAQCGAMERPAIVWFGEALPYPVFRAATEAARSADVLLAVGTMAVVYPAAGIIEAAAVAGATVIEVNPEPSALADLAGVELRGPAGELLPLVERELERLRGA
jgi:NAD-dependent deacetylase